MEIKKLPDFGKDLDTGYRQTYFLGIKQHDKVQLNKDQESIKVSADQLSFINPSIAEIDSLLK